MRLSKVQKTAGFALVLAGIFFLTTGFFSKVKPYKVYKTFPVQLKVDFGPAGKPAYDKPLDVEKGTTPKEAVSQVFPVVAGKSCCSLREVLEIDGVRVDPKNERWWICLVNGSKNISPQKKKLKSGDVIEWKYI